LIRKKIATKNIAEFQLTFYLKKIYPSFLQPDTIYYQFAKKMRDYGFKLLSREKLLTLRATVRCMRFLTAEELGFSLEASDIYYDTNAIRKKQTENKMAVFKTDISLNLAYAHAADTTDSRLMAPEGDDEELSADDEESREARARLVHEEVKELARLAAERLARKNPNGKVRRLCCCKRSIMIQLLLTKSVIDRKRWHKRN
jgi:hypothetical protein